MNIEWCADVCGGVAKMASAERKRNREEARKVLGEMNALIHGRDFAKMVMNEQFEELRCKIVSLGWLPLCKSLKAKGVPGKWDLRVQMKLVDPDSKEAKAYDLQ